MSGNTLEMDNNHDQAGEDKHTEQQEGVESIKVSLVFDDAPEDLEGSEGTEGAKDTEIPNATDTDEHLEGGETDEVAAGDAQKAAGLPDAVSETPAGTEEPGGAEGDNASEGKSSDGKNSNDAHSTGTSNTSNTSRTSNSDNKGGTDGENPRKATKTKAHRDHTLTENNAKHVEETFDLARSTGNDSQTETNELDQHKTQDLTAAAIAPQIDSHMKRGEEDTLLFRTYPTFALNHVTVKNAKTGRDPLNDVSWSCHVGTMYAITDMDEEQHLALLEIMGGFRLPTSGQVMFKSSSLSELDISEIRGHKIGMITQRYGVRPDLDALGNICYAMEASGRTFLKPLPVLARELLASVNFMEVSTGVPVNELSVVDQRRVAIARALSHEAEILIVDQPTDGLDQAESKIILTLLSDLAHNTNQRRCVIILTDSTEDAAAADKLLEL